MPNVFFDSPQTMINGTAKERDVQILAYLTYLSEKLNEALNCISVEQMAPEVQNQIQVSGSQASQQAAESDKKYYNNPNKHHGYSKSNLIKSTCILNSKQHDDRTYDDAPCNKCCH